MDTHFRVHERCDPRKQLQELLHGESLCMLRLLVVEDISVLYGQALGQEVGIGEEFDEFIRFQVGGILSISERRIEHKYDPQRVLNHLGSRLRLGFCWGTLLTR